MTPDDYKRETQIIRVSDTKNLVSFSVHEIEKKKKTKTKTKINIRSKSTRVVNLHLFQQR